MSYTLRGRLESRLAAAAVSLALAAALSGALRDRWPLELAGLMVGVGLALDVVAYHRLLPYQPGWLALPLGLLELGIVLGLARAAGVMAPLAGGIALFAVAWLSAQVLVHAALPLLHRSYGDDGGELGPGGAAVAVLVLGLLGGWGGVAWATRPPHYRLTGGIQRGPIVLDRPGVYEGSPSTVVRGGVVVRSDDVTLRHVRIEGGENGIDVEDAQDVVIDRVTVSGATLDGIHVRRSEVTIDHCVVRSPHGAYTQGIDISFGLEQPTSMVERCTVTGGAEGIVTHYANVMVSRNRVSGTSLRGITLTEMSMGMADRNDVDRALGVGIFCGDHSMCELEDNVVGGAGDPLEYAVVAQYGSEAKLRGNELRGPRRVQASPDSVVVAR